MIGVAEGNGSVDQDYVQWCRLAREAGAFWCAPDFFDGPLAYPKPNIATLKAVYETSMDKAIRRYGEQAVDNAAREVASFPDLRERLMYTADPFSQIMELAG